MGTRPYSTVAYDAWMKYKPGGTHAPLYFDYDHQVWVKDGVYMDCGHPESMACGCFGRLHAGERAS